MAKSIPHIDRYMTTGPHAIEPDQKLSQAHRLMREHAIRHLPVMRGDELIGVLSDRDLHLIETLRDVDPDKVVVEEAMSDVVYKVSPRAALDEVVSEMARHKYGCAVVVDHGKVVGVFTTVDALRAFAEMLETRLR